MGLEAPRPEKTANRGKAKTTDGRVELLERLLRSIERKLDGNDFKASVGDYIRLLQLKKELEEERPKEITVRWVEPYVEEDVLAK